MMEYHGVHHTCDAAGSCQNTKYTRDKNTLVGYADYTIYHCTSEMDWKDGLLVGILGISAGGDATRSTVNACHPPHRHGMPPAACHLPAGRYVYC